MAVPLSKPRGECGDIVVSGCVKILMCGTQPSHFSNAQHPFEELVGVETLVGLSAFMVPSEHGTWVGGEVTLSWF